MKHTSLLLRVARTTLILALSSICIMIQFLITCSHPLFLLPNPLPHSTHRIDDAHLMSSYLSSFLLIVQCMIPYLIHSRLFKLGSQSSINNFMGFSKLCIRVIFKFSTISDKLIH